MDYDLNDPLGDILTDDSDDSFFNDDKYKTGKTKNHQIINIEAKKSSLFGLEGPKEKENEGPHASVAKEEIKKKEDWLGFSDSNNKSNLKSTIPDDMPKQIGFKILANTAKDSTIGEKLDFLDDLDKSQNKPLETIPKEKFSLDDLLGKKPQTPIKTQETPPSLAPKKENAQSTFSGYTPTAFVRKIEKPAKAESQAAKNVETVEKSAPLNDSFKRQRGKQDWLGIFGDEDEDLLNGQKKEAKQKFSDLLNLSKEDEKSIKPKLVVKKPTPKHDENKPREVENKDAINDLDDFKQIQNELNVLVEKTLPNVDIGNDTLMNMSGSINVEQQSAALCLQQQESHLMVALQLKAQEERLVALQERQQETKRVQQEVVEGHRQQLDRMIQGQIEHRSQLQQIIMQHQRRINQHIQSLLKPPQNESKDYDRPAVENILEEESKKIYSKADQLEQMIVMIKENHDREIDLMESSFRRQLNLVNDSLSQIEERFKQENDKLSQYYIDKVGRLEEENGKIIKQFESKIQLINDQNESERIKLDQKHASDMEILQKQHRLMIDNIRDSVSQERSTLMETKDYSQILSKVLSEIDKNNKMCVSLMDNVENMASKEISSQAKALQVKEEQINRILDNLEKQRNLYESEITDKRLSMSVLEDRLKQQMQILDDERSILQKKESALMYESNKMKLECENMKKHLEMEGAVLQRNTENAKISNDLMNTEIEERLKKINEDAQKISNENRTIAEMKRECWNLKSKLEDEIKEVNEKKFNLKLEEERLTEHERKIVEKSRELEILTISALAKRKTAEEKLIEANCIQQKYQEKMNKIQEDSLSLHIREKEIAKDKIALSRERLILYNQQTETENIVCQLCKGAVQENTIPGGISKYYINNLGISATDKLFEVNISKEGLRDSPINHYKNGKEAELYDKNLALEQLNNKADNMKLHDKDDYETDFKDNFSYIFHSKFI